MEQNKLTLEKLIDLALVDGVVTDKERELIRKKAEREGYDPDEAEMVLDAKLQELQIQQQADVAKVKRCPNCGEPIPAANLVCPACGFEYQKAKANSSFTELSKQLDEAEKQRKIFTESNEGEKRVAEAKRIANIKSQVISTFPVPNTKDDLVEFITMAHPQTVKQNSFLDSGLIRFLIGIGIAIILMLAANLFISDKKTLELTCGLIGLFAFSAVGFFVMTGSNPERLEHNILANAWKSKVNQCMAKAKIMIKDPVEFEQMYAIGGKPKEKPNQKKIIIIALVILFVLFLLAK